MYDSVGKSAWFVKVGWTVACLDGCDYKFRLLESNVSPLSCVCFDRDKYRRVDSSRCFGGDVMDVVRLIPPSR